MKKIISLLLVLAMVLTLAACGNSGSGAKTYKIGVAIYQYNDNFMTLYRQEIENYFKTLETDTVKYEITMVDGKNDMGEQTNQIDTFITQKMDAIICNLVHERELKDCMHCRFFWGHNNRCANGTCCKPSKKKEQKLPAECVGCPYYQGNGYCFPCMRKLIGK